ncbi:P-loop NTPase fold protein [Lentzea tibetensis]|nr:P-loop NTPase fold protein [Lentzea tibetensis]
MTTTRLDGSRVLVVADDEAVTLWDLDSEKLVRRINGLGVDAQALRMIEPATCVISGFHGVQRCDLSTGEYTDLTPADVTDIPVVDKDRILRFRDSRSGYRYTDHRDLHDLFRFCAVARASGTVLARTDDANSIMLHFISLDTVRKLAAHSTEISALASVPTPDSDHLLVSASIGGTIRVWDPETGIQLRVFVPFESTTALTGFIGFDGGPRLVSADRNGLLQIWDLGMAPGRNTGPVLTRGFSDRVSTKDLLGREAVVATLVSSLRPSETDDDDTGPTVITVEGPWGSGKSTVLDLVRRRLHVEHGGEDGHRRLTVMAADRLLRKAPDEPEPTELPPARVPLVATFNPWRHQSSEQVWAGLAKSIVDAAERTMLRDRDRREHYWFTRNTERIDRRHTQRELWKRIRSPLLSAGVLGLGLSLVAHLTKLATPWPWVATAALFALGLGHTAKRYCWDRASAFLPAELFTGPVRSTAFASGRTGGDLSVRDPFYQAKSGYLYLVQHDVKAVLRSLAEQGTQLILLVDDLDRCTPRTTAEVFEAINVFLAEDFPRTRFVLGLDPLVVASHVDRAYQELADADIVRHPDDPSPGWTFLRKLVQLPVRLPTTTDDNVEHVLEAHLGPVHREEPVVTIAAAETPSVTPQEAEVRTTSPAPRPIRSPVRAEAVIVAIERDAKVREYLLRRLAAQQEHSVREEKRLINVWQFYLRVLASADVEQACHLVVVAEIVTRWPAYQHLLRRNWQLFADSVSDDVAWGAALAKAGFKRADERAATNLRALLLDCDAQAVAQLADRLL